MFNNVFKPISSGISLEKIRESFVNRLIAFFAVGAIPAGIASFSRASRMDIHWIMWVQLVIIAVVFLVFLFRDKISLSIKYFFCIFIFSAIGFSSIWAFGFATAGMSFLVAGVMVKTMVAGQKRALRGSVLMILGLIAMAFVHVQTQLVSTDLNFVVRDPWSWFSVIMGFSLVAIALSVAAGTMQESVRLLLEELELKNEEIRRLADTDYLTGLANRRVILDRLTFMLRRLSRHPGAICVLYLDLDGFKQINDTYDHAAGDFTLKTVANRLSLNVRPDDLVARLGGDEFMIVMQMDKRDPEAIEEIVQRLTTAVKEPFDYNQSTIACGASIGFVEYSEAQPGVDAEKLMRMADSAMFATKKANKTSSQHLV